MIINHININSTLSLPLYTGIQAGFPSPANDYLDSAIDLNKELIRNPSSTFFARVTGLSMKDDGIDEDDILIVDKSILPRSGMIAVCFIDGEFTLKKIARGENCILLLPANKNFKPITVTESSDFIVWGIVTYIIKKIIRGES
jgi:DNA polymerase V